MVIGSPAFRKMLLMGWTHEVVDDAKEIIYHYIKDEIGEDIPSLRPALSQHDAWEAWYRYPLSTSSEVEISHHDPHTPDDVKWDQNNRADHDDNNDTKTTTTIAVKTELRRRFGIKVIMADEIHIQGDREGVNRDTENNESDSIIIRRLSDKETIDGGESYETISVGMIVRCKTCLATIVEGEVIRFNTHTRMVIIRPTPTPSPFNNGLHMVNLDFVEEIRAVRMCASMPPVHADFDVTRHEVMEETEMEQYADRARQWARYESLQKESVNKPYLGHNVKKHQVLEGPREKNSPMAPTSRTCSRTTTRRMSTRTTELLSMANRTKVCRVRWGPPYPRMPQRWGSPT